MLVSPGGTTLYSFTVNWGSPIANFHIECRLGLKTFAKIEDKN